MSASHDSHSVKELHCKKAQAFVQENIQGIKGAQDVADGLGINYETLRKEFRSFNHTTLGRYIILERVKRAQLLLETTDLLCYQICEAVGFPNEVTGHRTFRRHVGKTMDQYRKTRPSEKVLVGETNAHKH
jgi:AraC family transcriptional regulator, transcriptional activator FtrA